MVMSRLVPQIIVRFGERRVRELRQRVEADAHGDLVAGFQLVARDHRQLDAHLGHQCFDDRVERLLYDLFRLELRQTDFVGNGLYDFFFGHDSSLRRVVAGSPPPS